MRMKQSDIQERAKSSNHRSNGCCFVQLCDIKYGISIWLIWHIRHRARKKRWQHRRTHSKLCISHSKKTVLLDCVQYARPLFHLSPISAVLLKRTYVCSAFHAVLNPKSISWIIKLFNLTSNPASFIRKKSLTF